MFPVSDPRLVGGSTPLPLVAGYADQPYVVVLPSGHWLCLVTTALSEEGHRSQGVCCLRSLDRGKTWSQPVRLEPPDAPENSYAVGLATPSGRVFAFYNFNTDNLREVRTEQGDTLPRVDSLGEYVFRFSDDGGLSWSPRHIIPVRSFHCDRTNVYGGKVRFFWNVGRPCIRQCGQVIIPLHKVGAMGSGFFAQSEGAFISSDNILTERDPLKIVFETLPDGEHGLRTPPGGGRVAEEQSIVELSDGSLYCVYRTVDGWPVCTYSRDGGRSWEPPQYKTYVAGGKRLKNPRAANFVWKISGNRYLYWFHNHGGAVVRSFDGHSSLPNGLSPVNGRTPYDDRNPAWLCAGREIDGPKGKLLEWSQPEILLYDDDPKVRISYPDLIEENGSLWITETDKRSARIHEIEPNLIQSIFARLEGAIPPAPPLPLISGSRPGSERWHLALPSLPLFTERDYSTMTHGTKDMRSGCAVELEVEGCPSEGEVLFDSLSGEGAGIQLRISQDNSVEALFGDGCTTNAWRSDPQILDPLERNHVSLILDGGPKIVMFVVNGVLCDGGDERQFGWGRFSPNLRQVDGAAEATISSRVAAVRIYSRALRISECNSPTGSGASKVLE